MKASIAHIFLLTGVLFSCNDTDFSGVENKKEEPNEPQTGNVVIHAEIEEQDPIEPPPPQRSPSKAKTFSHEFTVNKTKDHLKTLEVSDGILTEIITLKNSYSQATESASQVDRPMKTDIHKQGAWGTLKAESFTQEGRPGLLDILVVVDTSASMAEEQENLSTKLNPLLEHIGSSDWRIGVTTTDPNDPCMRAIINKGDVNAENMFKKAVNAGTGGAGNEQGFRQAVDALKCESTPWIRPQSSIAILFVSDEDNCSNGFGCEGTLWKDETYLLNALTNDLGRKLNTEARIYGLIWHPNTVLDDCDTGTFQGNQYAAAIDASGGTYGNICADDYTDTLKEISKDVNQILKSQFSLSQAPEPGTLEVKVNDIVVTNYTIVDKVITFSEAPVDGSNIIVSYRHGTTPRYKTFALSENPSLDTVQVLVNSQMLDPNTYTVSKEGKTITFNNPPVDNSQISFQYRQDIPLLTDFSVSPNAVLDTLTVKVNGTATTEYTLEGYQVKFNTPPADNSKIEFSFTKNDGPVLNYSVALDGEGTRDVKAYDWNGQIIPLVWEGDKQITLKEENHKEGQKVLLKYRNEKSGLLEYALPEATIPESVKVSTSDDENCVLGKDIQYKEGVVTVQCNFEGKLAVSIQYSEDIGTGDSYSVPGIEDPEAGEWSVSINGEETTGFIRNGVEFDITEETENYDRIKITFTTLDTEEED